MDIHVRSNEELHKLMEKVDKHLDGIGREVGDLKEKLDTTGGEYRNQLQETVKRLEDSEAAWTQIRERLDTLDKRLSKGNKIYLPHDGAAPKSEIRQEMARFFLDGMSMALTRKTRFGSDYFKRFDGVQADIGQTVADNAEGGYLVPPEFRQEILRIAETYGFARRYFRVIPIARNEMFLPTHASGPAVEWVDEAEGPTETKATFGRIQLKTKRLMAVDTLSIEIMEESIPFIADFLIDVFGEKIAKEEDRVALAGDVTANPTTDPFDGVMTDAGHTVFLGGANNSGKTSFADVDYEDLINLVDAVNEFVADRSIFAFSNHVTNQLRKIRTDAAAAGDRKGLPLWQEMALSNPPSVLGRPFVKSASMPKAADDAAGANMMIYGDFRNAILADRMANAVAFSEHADFKRGNIVMRLMERVGFKVAIADAFAVLKTAST